MKPPTISDRQIPDGSTIRSIVKAQRDDTYDKTRAMVARDIGDGLCILIGNLMIENQEAGNKLGDQLESFIKHQIKGKWLKGDG